MRALAPRAGSLDSSEVLFLQVDFHTSGQRRRETPSAATVILDDLVRIVLPVAITTGLVFSNSSLAVVATGAVLHWRVIPRARHQILASLGELDLDDVRGALCGLNRLDRWIVATTVIAGIAAVSICHVDSSSPVWMVGLGVRPRTLNPRNLTSKLRDGVVDVVRLGTAHTQTDWILTIRQPITLRIPTEDPDLADIVMVLLHTGTRALGRPYLDQATVGKAFRISRQVVQERMSLYRRRKRIEDVIGRSRQNHTLTAAVVEAIHRLVLEDPLISTTVIRERLVAEGIITSQKDIALSRIDCAVQTVDYLAIRTRLREQLGKGERVPHDQNLLQRLLQEMKAWAPVVGRKAGQVLLPMQTVMALAAPVQKVDREEDESQPQVLSLILPSVPSETGTGASRDARWSFLLYFTCGAPYREIASFLGVSASTIYRRLVALRKHLPPLQKSLGPIRFSGVVGIDEKYILAPKSRRKGKMGRWVYLFIAIDPWSYDLLHADVYPTRTADCARAFLMGLKANGVVTPRAIVTDLWGPYETVIPDIYPGAAHHQCVFHAEQATSTLMRDKLGHNYAEVPAARELKSAIIHLFRAGSRRTLMRRYLKLLKQQPQMVQSCPELASVFESLTRHFSKLANAYSSRQISIPKTNNAVEIVIRTFTRRYKTMAGFHTLETARGYVQLWTYYYRFRPFSPDANVRIRNKSPLQIAGYEVQGLTCLDLVMPPPQVS